MPFICRGSIELRLETCWRPPTAALHLVKMQLSPYAKKYKTRDEIDENEAGCSRGAVMPRTCFTWAWYEIRQHQPLVPPLEAPCAPHLEANSRLRALYERARCNLVGRAFDR